MIYSIITAMKQEITYNSAQPKPAIGVKIRSGWDMDSLNFMETAAAAVSAGAELVCIHPRTTEQGYSGSADWSHISRLKDSLGVPVIGSGDLFSPEDGLRMLSETGCDGIMFARGAQGNPFIFQQTKELLSRGRVLRNPGWEEKIITAIEHIRISERLKGREYTAKEMKKHLSSYTKGLPHGASLRQELMTSNSVETMLTKLETFRLKLASLGSADSQPLTNHKDE
jgi:nifR3 family TIM-barrel protein